MVTPAKLAFYFVIFILVMIDSALLASPNFLGKIGVIIYKYSYIKTFPRTIVTVTTVAFIAAVLSEVTQLIVARDLIKKKTGIILLVIFSVLTSVWITDTIIDFSAWTYRHTGFRFRVGAYLLPLIVLTIFVYGIYQVKRYRPFPKDISEADQTVEGKQE